MTDYRGAASEGSRVAILVKKREKEREDLERLKKKIQEDNDVTSGGKFASVEEKYSGTQYDTMEEQLVSNTIGLVTLEEMKTRRDALVQEREKKLAANLLSSDTTSLGLLKAKKKQQSKGTLSFNMDDEEDVDGENEDPSPSPPPVKKKKFATFGKDPRVDTSFLPDRDREDEERCERERLRQEWQQSQDALKEEQIIITYSYWDGSGHRKKVTMKKGDTISQLLQKCLESLRKEFTELRTCGIDGLMFIKEDLIIPQHYSFYDFIINKARGKSGPLFAFDVHDDVRLVGDAAIEKDESHAGKIVLRSWYERNKHIFPASRWEPYDPEKTWDKYTISDKNQQ